MDSCFSALIHGHCVCVCPVSAGPHSNVLSLSLLHHLINLLHFEMKTNKKEKKKKGTQANGINL